MQQAARHQNSEIQQSIKSDRWTLALPLLCWLALNTLLIFLLSLASVCHYNFDIGPTAGRLIFFSFLGIAGFCMPALSWLQAEKLGWQRAIRWRDEQERLNQEKIVKSLRDLAAAAGNGAGVVLALREFVAPPPVAPGGRPIPSLTLTPRLLAQRPFIRPRARAGAF